MDLSAPPPPLVLSAAAVGWQAGFSRGADAFDPAALALKQPPTSTPNPHTEIMWIAAPIGRPAGASLACALYDVAPRTFAELLHNYIPTTGPNGCLGVGLHGKVLIHWPAALGMSDVI